MSKLKPKFLIPVIGAAIILVGGIATYLYLKSGPSGGIADATASAKLVPDDAMMATYIATDSTVWSKLEQFGTPEAQKIIASGLKSFNDNLSSDNSISYDKDLKPWVSGVMIAVLPPQKVQPAQDSPSAGEANILMVVGIKDKVQALNFANKLKQQKDVKSTEIDYKGQKIQETKSTTNSTYSTILNDHVLFSASQNAVQQAIDTSKGEPSFLSKSGAFQVMGNNLNLENTLAQIYVPDYPGMVKNLIANNQQTRLPPQTLEQLKQVKSVVAGIGVDDSGLRMKANANLNSQLVKYHYEKTNGRVLSQFPQNTIALISGGGINKWWTAFVEQAKDAPELNVMLQQARGQLQSVDLDLDKDIFGWMDGEFGIAAIPLEEGLLKQVGFGGAFLFHTGDRKTAEATLSKLDNLAKAQSIQLSQKDINGKKITEWQIPGQGALLAHGWLDEKTALLTLGGPIAEILSDKSFQPLNSGETFQGITATLPKENGGYLYIDMEKALPVVNRFSPPTPEATAILNSIRGIGVTATSPNKSLTQMEMLLALKPKE
ncbi:DUF3352 domain-containing protein [Plectonema cf. radiosum LEGE 06105]|uniref:DUF3352 domain-containing protein n=1 Tax=Plectonema cf. radiosum LEGE 06105 TaxID=945769 RepID=A0A8J7F9L0_9CYAN|nr:DUF3352 domain-containing protein [Plectonema radiosum]MBE9214629.1 DUF3352 domain-containing protein [Plectonema cf. radiosum LEGE 06105]